MTKTAMTRPVIGSIQERLDFMGLGTDAQERLRRQERRIDAAMDRALDRFYKKVRSVPVLQRHFPNEDIVKSARGRQHQHWRRILKGLFDEEYAASVIRVGDTHAMIGLEPRWYIGGYGIVLDEILQEVVGEQRTWSARSRVELARDLSVVVRAALFDMEVATTAYLQRVEEARRQSEEQQKKDFDMIAAALARLAGGDLEARVDARLDERTRFNETVEKLAQIISGVRRATDLIDNGTSEIAAAADDLARRTEQQAASLEQTAASLDQLTNTVNDSANRAKEAEAMANHARDVAEKSSGIADETRSAMHEVSASAQEMGQIIGVINEIAFQTNLLALNAGVEAARAGESGRGFAVVAAEVRALAQRSSEAVSTIQQLIDRSAQQTRRGAELVGSTHDVLGEIVGLFRSISGIVLEMATSTRHQAVSISEINQAVRQLDLMTQQNAAMVEQTNATTSSLKGEAGSLSRMVSHFGGSAMPQRTARNLSSASSW